MVVNEIIFLKTVKETEARKLGRYWILCKAITPASCRIYGHFFKSEWLLNS